MNSPARLAVFVSGGGTNLQALLDRFNAQQSPVARVELVLSNRAGAGALARAKSADVESHVFDPAGADIGSRLASLLAEFGIDLIVLAGYLKLVPPEIVAEFSGRMINIHPALLPSFGGPGLYGQRVHRAVLNSGARVTGPTVHLVTERYDEGRILGQWPVPVLPGDTPESLAARVLRVEHVLLPAVIEAMVTGESLPAVPHSEMIFGLDRGIAPESDAIRSLLDFPDE